MKKILIVFLTLCAFHVQAQEKHHPLDSLFRDVVFQQLVNNLEVEYPIVIFTPTFSVYGTMNVTNNNIYFENYDFSHDYFKNTDQIITNDIKRFVPLDLISENLIRKNLNIKSFGNGKLLFTIANKNKEDVLDIEFYLPGDNYYKNLKFEETELVSSEVKKKNKRFLKSIEKRDNNTLSILKYNISKRKYQQTIKEFRGDKIISKTIFRRNNNREGEKIKEIKRYLYNSDGRLYKTLTENRKGEKTDSTLYIYKNNLIASISYQSVNNNSSITYFYNDKDHLVRKEVRTPNETLFLEYNFDNNGRLVNYKVVNPKKLKNSLYSFTYNKDGELIEIKNNENYDDNNLFKTVSQYSFSYDKNGNINTIRDIGHNGNIMKEIKYEIEIMDEN